MIIKSTTPKAFCAGGDIKGTENNRLAAEKKDKDVLHTCLALLDRTASGEKLRRKFFREEYGLNYLTGTYKLPYVALINGITMGGVRY